MSPASSSIVRWFALALVVTAGFWLRTHELARRPMHADEANQAVKLGELLENGRYAFDPRDHHGPTLYYAAVPIAWIRGQRTLAALDETTVRLVPALFGTAAIVLLFLLARPLGAWPALAAAAFLALSPPAVYYSRYFIQETLLVTFTLAALVSAQRGWRTHRLRWAALAGVSAGLMQSTKASAPLFLAAALVAFLLARGRERERVERPAPPVTRPLVTFTVTFLLTFAVFYSSFFTNFTGLRDSLAAYAHAFTRFGAAAAPTGHEKPFAYYFLLFGWFKNGGLVWHQLAFSALALTGLVLAFLPRRPGVPGRRFLRFVAVFTLLITLTFSCFAYKTPWHAVHFIPGFALLAAAALAAIARLNTGRPVAAAFALVTFATLYQQTGRAAFLRPADQRNPYAYVHSAPDVLKYRAVADAALARFPRQPIRVISEEYWPLPWYLRGLANVGYHATPPADCDAALLIVSPEHTDTVRSRLKLRYRETFLGLRPGVLLVLFIQEP